MLRPMLSLFFIPRWVILPVIKGYINTALSLKLVDLARKEKINTVFIQRGFDAKNAKVIAEEIDAELFEIDPMTYKWDEELIKIATILSRH